MLHANISTAALACYVCGNACKTLYGRSCADYSVTSFKGITVFDNSELLYRVGLMCTAFDALQSACEPRLSASSVALQTQ